MICNVCAAIDCPGAQDFADCPFALSLVECSTHGLEDCGDPMCDPYGVLHAELRQAERG